jgi:hypothetical protein
LKLNDIVDQHLERLELNPVIHVILIARLVGVDSDVERTAENSDYIRNQIRLSTFREVDRTVVVGTIDVPEAESCRIIAGRTADNARTAVGLLEAGDASVIENKDDRNSACYAAHQHPKRNGARIS